MSIGNTRLWLTGILLAAALPAQQALLWHGGDLVSLPEVDLHAAVARSVAGPTPLERATGWGSAVPVGTELQDVTVAGGRCTITLDARFLDAIGTGEVERAIEQLSKTALQSSSAIFAVDIYIAEPGGATRELGAILRNGASTPRLAHRNPTTAQANVQGALTGRTIVISPGHGYYWHSSLGWTTQRPLIGELIEDIHTNEIAMRWLIPVLENMGARVISCRERGETTGENLVDDDGGAPDFTTSGTWSVSASTGYNNGGYRYAATSPGSNLRATWHLSVPADDIYPVYAWFRASGNRTDVAHYEITHSGGTDTVTVDQTRDNLTWRHLGDFWFEGSRGATIAVTADAPAGKVVIADTIRIGGGRGSIARNGTTSGQARWREAARYWTQFAGAPSSVWNSISGGEDNSDDVTARPRFAEWLGADAFLSLHTNAGGGLGTSSYIYNGGATAGSSTLQARVHDQIVQDIRAGYLSTWQDRGKLQANFGEVRLLSTMPGVLVELAFHDTIGSVDHDALHDPVFRRLAGRAMARGVLRYFQATAPFPPEPPPALRVTQDGARGLTVSWFSAAGAAEYTVEQSQGGKGFTEVARTPFASWSTGPLEPGTALCFRVRSWNASGRSLPTEVLVGMTSHRGSTADLLLVQAFDRLDRWTKLPDNTSDYLPRHLLALRAARAFSLAVDSSTNEAVQVGAVPLPSYPCVAWACGEESTEHETFSNIEQSLVRNYVNGGGNLLVSGAEIGWDLEARGNASDLAFHRQVLGAVYVADDAGTHGFRSRAGSIFTGLPNGSFDDGSGPTYDVNYPDVLAPADGFSSVALEYSTGATAALQRDTGNARVVYLGFPIETILDDALRGQIMQRALRFLLAPRQLQVQETVAPGGSASITLDLPARFNSVYWLMCAFDVAPAISLPGNFTLALAPDGLFFASLDPNNPLFTGFLATLDSQGHANAGFNVPPIPVLSGIQIFISGLVFQPASTAIGTVLPWARLEIR